MNVDIITRRSALAAASWNAEDWTFELILSTGAPVERHDSRGAYLELLAVDGATFPATLPLLDSHARDSLDAKLGTVDSINVVDGKLVGRARLSRHNPRSQRIAAELGDGQTFGVSIGYRVEKWAERTGSDKRREKVAVAFSVIEASLVILPADPNSGIRTMETQTDPAVVDRAAANVEIRSIARVAGLDQAWIDTQIDAAATVETARAAAFEAMQARSRSGAGLRTQATVGMDYTDPEFRVRTIGEALYARVTPTHTPSEAARPYVGMSIPEVARDCLRNRGFSTMGLGASTIIERALQSTSDFPLLLADALDKTLRQAYQTAPAGVRQVARATTARDFRAKHRIQFSTAPTLLPLNEHGEFVSGGMNDYDQTYAVTTFGRIVGFTRQAMVNDDLGAFADTTRRMGVAAAAFEATFLANIVSSNPTLADGNAVFSTAHANITGNGSGTTLSLTTLSAARQAMRAQTGLLGELIDVTPRYLLVGPANETIAEQMVSEISPIQSQDVNPFMNKIHVVVDPRLTANIWYLVADASQVDGLEYAYLEGAAGPQITSDLGFEVDGVRFRIRLDFGGAFVDWRGWYAAT
jgi:Mu-like prophage major head subunit gpT